MKKFYLCSLLASLVLLITACGGNAGATKDSNGNVIDGEGPGNTTAVINLPDSTIVDIDGELHSYFRVKRGHYQINIVDSVPTIGLTMDLICTYGPGNFSVAEVSNPEGSYSELPYLVLLDAEGQPIAGSEMATDKSIADALSAGMKSTSEVSLDPKFVGKKLTAQQLKDVTDKARGMKLVAKFKYIPDQEKIEKGFKEYQEAISTAETKRKSLAGSNDEATIKRLKPEWTKAVKAAKSKQTTLSGGKIVMDDAQKAKLEQLNNKLKQVATDPKPNVNANN